jgi:hypothetical protein
MTRFKRTSTQIGSGAMALFAVTIEDDRGRRGMMLTRRTRADVVRSMALFEAELGRLSDYLHARRP